MSVKHGLTTREEHRLTVSEKRVLRRIHRPKKEEIIRGQKKLHEEKLRNLFS
jgi:hypothetical protein